MTKIKVANQSEALYGFAAWLTTRAGTLKVGAEHDASPMATLVDRFCTGQGFAEPRDAFPKMLNSYPAK